MILVLPIYIYLLELGNIVGSDNCFNIIAVTLSNWVPIVENLLILNIFNAVKNTFNVITYHNKLPLPYELGMSMWYESNGTIWKSNLFEKLGYWIIK